MAYIQIDSRGCGVGKTRNTIIPRIRNNLWNGIETLVVVPSMRLQKEYARYFIDEDFTVINCENKNPDSVLTQYQTATTPVKCITHSAFKLIPTSFFEKQNTDLILDEVFDPYLTAKLTNYDSAGRVWLNTNHLFEVNNKIIGNFCKLQVVQSTPPSIIDKKLWHQISNTNFDVYSTVVAAENLMNNSSETTELFQALKPDVLLGWKSVWIAAAVFEKTLFGSWFNSLNFDSKTVYEFKKHKQKIVWHMPNDESKKGFSWTKGCKQTHPELMKQFFSYVDEHRTGRVIYNINNDDKTPIVWGKRITHNAHGVNEYSDYANYCYFSAINPTNSFKSFIQQHCGIESKDFKFAFSGYMAYQLLMRTRARKSDNSDPVDVFLFDTNIALEIMDLFDADLQIIKADISVPQKQPRKTLALTPAEKQKLYRERKKKNKTDSQTVTKRT